MKPETRTTTQLFGLDVRYVVPLYQRPYVWNKRDQWEPLWGDIELLLARQLAPTPTLDGSWSHFLGAIVLDQEIQAPGTIPLFTLIDGQQRLTTLQILLAAASRVAADIGADNEAELLIDLTANNPRKASGTERFKVWPTNLNREAFKAVMAKGGPSIDREDDPNNEIDEAYEYFVMQIADWLNEETANEDRVSRMRTLRVTLTDLLKVVSITLEPGDNAQIIFETLNARGTPLLALDLVKNAVFLQASREEIDVDALYETIWKPELEDGYWRANKRQGRLFRPRADLFLMYWLGMKLRRVIPATELFTTFRSGVLKANPEPQMDVLIKEFCRDARTLRGFDDLPYGSVEGLFFERLEALDVATVMPLVLFLFREPTITEKRRRRALSMLESWLVRRALVHLTVKNYNQLIPGILEKVASDPALADDKLLDELRSGVGDISRWPRDEEIIGYLSQNDSFGKIPQSRLVMALAAVERSLYSKKTDIPSIPKRLSIEHVIPQGWKRNWPLKDGRSVAYRTAATEARQSRIHRLGNLTLTASSLNSTLSNGAWSAKQRALNRESKLLINAKLIEDYPTAFDEKAIDKRTNWLAKKMCTIWPGPDGWN